VTPVLILALLAGDLWSHVYHPGRFIVHDPGVTITGSVVLLRKEKDGDWHIQIRLDPKYRPLLNAKNRKLQGGNLVVEPICVLKVTQADAIEACRGYVNEVTIPKKGDRVKVTGAYVTDTQHGWTELHPVDFIEITK
jgi:hypothetical protein